MPPLDPDVADLTPSDPALTAYDEPHAITYVRMLDADAEGTPRPLDAQTRCIRRELTRVDEG